MKRSSNFIRAGFFFGFAALASWMPLLNLWLEKKNLEGYQIGLVSAIPWVIMFLIQPLMGMLADRMGKLKLLRVLLLLSAISFALIPGLSFTLTGMVGSICLMALVNTPVLALYDSVTLDYTEQEEGQQYAYLRMWGALGYAGGALSTGYLVQQGGLDMIFFTSAGYSIVMLLLSFGAPVMERISNRKDISFAGLRKVVDAGLIMFLVIIMLVAIGQSAINFYLSIYLDSIGSGAQNNGVVFGVQAISELPFYFIAAWMLRKVAAQKIVVMAIFFTAIRLSLYVITNDPSRVIFIEMMNGVTWTVFWISSVEYVDRYVPSQYRCTGQSLLWAAYFGAGSVTGNFLSGVLYQQVGITNTYLINSILIGITAFVGLFIYFRPLRVKPAVI